MDLAVELGHVRRPAADDHPNAALIEDLRDA
jgi:hypothetical protein